MNKWYAVSLFIVAVLAVSNFVGGQGWLDQRSAAINQTIAQMPPYTFSATPNVAAADWTVPDTIQVGAIYSQGYGKIKLQYRTGSIDTVAFDSLCGIPFDVIRIYSAGTASNLQTAMIKVFGWARAHRD